MITLAKRILIILAFAHVRTVCVYIFEVKFFTYIVSTIRRHIKHEYAVRNVFENMFRIVETFIKYI